LKSVEEAASEARRVASKTALQNRHCKVHNKAQRMQKISRIDAQNYQSGIAQLNSRA
jgi:hypothetical protein